MGKPNPQGFPVASKQRTSTAGASSAGQLEPAIPMTPASQSGERGSAIPADAPQWRAIYEVVASRTHDAVMVTASTGDNRPVVPRKGPLNDA